MATNINRFDSRDALIDALLQQVVAELGKSLSRRNTAALLLSGGSTPEPLYRRLSTAELAWDKIHLALIDERWVAADDAASNESLLRKTLLQNQAVNARFTGMKNPAQTPALGVDDCNRDYSRLPRPYTLSILGMGPDGHTASLFPNAEGLQQAMTSTKYCAAIKARRSQVTGDLLDRMTMTPHAILQSERLMLLITGEDKLAKLQEAEKSGDSTLTPISYFTQQTRPLEVYWAP